MKSFKIDKLIKLLEQDLSSFNNLDMTNLQNYTNSDIKLETGMVQYIINTIPGDLKICEIDLKQKDSVAFDNSFKKLLTKLKLVSNTNTFFENYIKKDFDYNSITLNEFEKIKQETTNVITALKKL